MPIPADFDVTKFETGIMTKVTEEVNKAVNGATKGLKTDFQKMMDELKTTITTTPAKKEGEGDAPPEGEAKTIAEMNAKFKGLENQLKTTSEKLTKAEQDKEAETKKRIESERVGAFDRVISSLEFPTDRAKNQFRAAYIGKVEYDTDGNLIVKDDKGEPVAMDGYLRNEYAESPHLQPASVRPGSGATSTQTTKGKSNFRTDMTPAEINALPADQKAAFRQEVANVAQATMSGQAA